MQNSDNALLLADTATADLDIDYYNIKKASMVLRALNHRLRQEIFNTIYVSRKITVTQLFIKLNLEQSVASQHLAILRSAGMVSTQRDGKHIYYSINQSRLEEINLLTKRFVTA